MRKIETCALVILALVLATPAAIGQEKPKVEVRKPIDRLLEEFKADIELQKQVELQRAMQLLEAQVRTNTQIRLMFLDQNANGTVVHLTTGAQPLMEGDLETAVEEIEKALRVVQGGDLAQGLAALDVVQRAIMKARTLLRTQKDPIEVPSEAEMRAFSQLQFFRAALQQSDTTPLGKARSALGQAVVSVRQATDVEEARKAFDKVEESTAILRALLWEKKTR